MNINYIAVLAAAVVSMGVGFLWYSPTLFGKAWMKLMGYTQEDLAKAKKEMGKLYALSFVATLVMAYVLTHVMILSKNFYGYSPVTTGLTTAFWSWLGFVAPVQLADELFGGKRWKLFCLNTGYQLASLLAMGVVIGMIG
ncbi:hypothetical protein A2631_00735 [Candidatus Daviesbacteria bacterium RIFCSPHIGHO2_01_FULL_44_29]|uniref:DUF1761 domain-containing protein n=1 Tax=Candidatus Daviesbacteria bacterium RIFCSPHIGHO2_02_FULL_43_12 TaxID=1797776 RepID=A0A1F5KH22_9BACT|nr:MAG: hypothetical protein A2631_00735 [Candidatus Daviesbacteria bacterium RIFCSPHIGHO2_01_FULL_44_29]OGE39367.1 MAG: hypothetical protein A3E86_01590 [Candidatus Daviesbacteria bacterium RIFCSPHIGHO2_12_FULL_47_45]OGE40246.1 MAG: hypothetical protein A3D25_05200 [Candidatus Daviesbacteria bacterium RIFCSPHIGHO2_02_FULL_43_12]OGE69045.1 MAG: hypothetical protein A3B55_02280 [Candidatus Daviesbacteria bacterium RIFCSPLOWO2_01_FULL_43_15]